ncbi:alpha/beta hydrolase [Aureimonas sp. AU40]|uniref:alpha/beta hydrolase n=1 Tax=Aureimonas sp. AU40 TaxID=1637747 RepID=UPI0007811EAD|nr:alpha/beta hydrolase [Aureimonas sp. AU40]
MSRFLPRLLGLVSLCVLAGCSAPAFLNAVTSRAGFETVRDLRYAPGDRGTYDLYVPNGATATTPVVVFIHGGSWDGGSKALYPFVGQSLASAGFVVAIPNYRLYPQVTFPGFVEDGAKATAVVAKLARDGGQGIPAGRHPLFLMGHSAGAQIAGLLAFDERYLARVGLKAHDLAGFVGLAGPYDFLPIQEERYKAIFPPATRTDSQPVRFPDGREAPTLLIAGLADTTVNPEETRSMARAIEAKGGRVETQYYPGLDHIGAVSSLATALPLGNPALRDRVILFLKAHSR